ncbi:MAG TPA: beta-ketoacyl-[acyl-carrier-protein] synthase II [Aeromonadales bacterium]|nr:beta-ketoacyl-[acyl-carrier-protein] synthase II [Aeromonadales bacterium]
MSKKRVVITGVGVVTPLGNSIESTWNGLLAGKSGIGEITSYDASNFSTRFCGEIRDLDMTPYMSSKDCRKFDPFIQYGVAATAQAIEQSGFLDTDYDKTRVGIIMGAGIGGMTVIEKNAEALFKSGPRRISPFFVPGSIINMVSGQISIQYGFTGPNLAIVTACTSGLHSIGHAARIIAYGDADYMIAGGAEKASTPLSMGGFSSSKALSKRNDEPQKASRPWDRDRDGFVLSDGAGVLVLEEYEAAKSRNATILAEIIGFGMSGDAYHMTSPPSDGAGAALAMRNAINDAELNPADIDYINAHGTSTKMGDLAETVAIKDVFGSHAHELMVSSTKSMTGHMLGAAGAVETVFCVKALEDQKVPPTTNLDNPDEGCDLDYVANVARDATLDNVICNSFGFGGTNGSLVLKRV